MKRSHRSAALAAVVPVLMLAPLPVASATDSVGDSGPGITSSATTGSIDDPGRGSGADTTVVINEVESNGDADGDWVELANTDPDNSVDVAGWTIIDGDDSHNPIVLPQDTEIESGGYLVVSTDDSFGLGSTDSVTLSDSSGAVIDETNWSGHAATTWGRVPDMSGDFTVTGEPTKGLRNVAPGETDGAQPGTEPWPFDPQNVTPVTLTDDHAGRFTEDFTGEDMSGVDFGNDGKAYVVNNDEGVLYVLSPKDGNSYHVDARHQLRYPDGTGLPDAEGVTLGQDGAVYVATERDNSDATKKTSRPSVLRYELRDAAGVDDAELTATDEWNLAEFTGDVEANGGPETVSWIFGSLFAVGVEETGDVLLVDLSGDAATLVQRVHSSLEGVMASDYDAYTGELTVMCDEVCGGASQVLVAGDGEDGADFAPKNDTVHARPAGTGNLANEGYARHVAPDGTERFLWADDGATDGVGLRGAVGTDGGGARRLPL
ncbi:lamin tail domain-containing protein [Corynebacterium sp.]|uniref:lamin tail domain-containing protein n=1 Tax=Corynebacterium sp. TaxID=1720 RepID=UPI0025BCD6E6|nr:lamin tail domain-containing protein [Corynebacterium sp.]